MLELIQFFHTPSRVKSRKIMRSNTGNVKTGLQEPETREVKLGLTAISAQVKFLQGKVLTIVEAVIVNEAQLKAVKDLIKRQFNEQLSWITELCYPDARNVFTGEQFDEHMSLQGIEE